MNRIFAGLWFGKGKPHFPTFLQPIAISLRTLYNPGNKHPAHGRGRVVALKNYETLK